MLWTDEYPDPNEEPAAAMALENWLAFREFAQPELLYEEWELVSTVGPMDRLGYGGTLDMVITLPDGRVVLVDVKTSRKLTAYHAYQVAAYARAWRDADLQPALDEGWVLRLNKYGQGYEIREVDLETGWDGFYHAHQLYRGLELYPAWKEE